MILTATQAKAIYTAMQTMNNVGMRGQFRRESIIVNEYADGVVHVLSSGGPWPDVESYRSQQAFAEAYGLA